MSKNILIVENDAALSRAMKDKLVARGFEVEETNDGKGCAELIRRTKPSLVVLAVDLSAGQNGYIICKKLKSDDELKAVPVIIVGNPDGFGQHKKLKTHADDYLGKPFDPPAIIDRAGALIGLPELPAQEVVEDESMNLDDLLDEDKQDSPAEDIALDSPTHEETVGTNDPDFEMVDAMFDDKTGAPKGEPPEELKSADRAAPGPPLPSPPAPRPSTSDATDMRALKSRVTELTGTLDEAKGRNEELEEKVRELESQLETKQTELETARSAGGKSDNKDLFALKDQVNKKDKEILRLKNELNEKEKEVVDLHEKETALEQQMSEASGEMARRDAQIKTLTTKGDQLAAERKKVDQQMMTAKEEGRSAGAKLTTLQADFDSLQERSDAMETELGMLRTTSGDADSARQEAEAQLSELRGEHDALKSQHEERDREVEEVRGQLEQAQIDLDSAKTQLGSQASAFAEEMGGLRKKLSDLEDAATRNEGRVKALFARIKSEESLRERTRESLQQALAALEEQPAESVDELMSEDELAEA
ncbi:MAG: frzS [Myxococcaceae bacterium]|nr:frzS [Myxococcaceae bacterium]